MKKQYKISSGTKKWPPRHLAQLSSGKCGLGILDIDTQTLKNLNGFKDY